MVTTSIEQPPSSIFSRAICIAVGLSRPGTRKKVNANEVETPAADSGFIHVSKDLLQSKELQTVGKIDGEIRRYLTSICLPSPLFKGGVYLIPLALVEPADQKLEALRAQRGGAVAEAVRVYPIRQEEAKARLGWTSPQEPGLYNPLDYPSVERFEAAFGMDVKYLTFGVPGVLESISRTIFEREQEKAARSVAEATDEIVTVLRLGLLDCIDHFVERTTPGPDGRPKVFRDSLITNFTEFLENFPARNLTDNRELADVVEEARRILAGVDAGRLRESQDVRTYVNAGMARLKVTIDGMRVTERTARTRHIELPDEPAAATEAA